MSFSKSSYHFQEHKSGKLSSYLHDTKFFFTNCLLCLVLWVQWYGSHYRNISTKISPISMMRKKLLFLPSRFTHLNRKPKLCAMKSCISSAMCKIYWRMGCGVVVVWVMVVLLRFGLVSKKWVRRGGTKERNFYVTWFAEKKLPRMKENIVEIPMSNWKMKIIYFLLLRAKFQNLLPSVFVQPMRVFYDILSSRLLLLFGKHVNFLMFAENSLDFLLLFRYFIISSRSV